MAVKLQYNFESQNGNISIDFLYSIAPKSFAIEKSQQFYQNNKSKNATMQKLLFKLIVKVVNSINS